MLRHIVMKAVLVLISMTHTDVMSTETSYLHAEPTYAKWGRLAMEETAKAYHNASIIDYKYEGRKQLPNGESLETFVLWLRNETREFGVRVSIRIHTEDDTLIDVTVNELPSQR